MRFSVIVPIYKVEKYLRQCLDSILCQTFEDFELILVDDGSPDRCPQICDEYAQKDSRIKVIHKENGGLSEARNSGVKIAKGEYLIFIDSDDFYDNDTVFEDLDDKIEKTNADIVQIRIKMFYVNNGIYAFRENVNFVKLNEKSVAKKIKILIENNMLYFSACQNVISRGFFIENNLFFKPNIKSEDIEWGFRVFIKNPEIVAADKPVYVYRANREGSITSTIDYKHLLDYCDLIEGAINNLESNKTEISESLLSVAMYHVLICIALCKNVKCTKKQRRELLARLKIASKGRVTKYTLDSRVKLASKIYRLFGFNAMSFAMGYYLKHRKEGTHTIKVVKEKNNF